MSDKIVEIEIILHPLYFPEITLMDCFVMVVFAYNVADGLLERSQVLLEYSFKIREERAFAIYKYS